MNANLFISDNALSCDEGLFFGKLDSSDLLHKFDPTTFTFEQLAEIGGLFSSRTQARKNGWSGPIPLGFGSRKCGKRMVHWFNSMDSDCD